MWRCQSGRSSCLGAVGVGKDPLIQREGASIAGDLPDLGQKVRDGMHSFSIFVWGQNGQLRFEGRPQEFHWLPWAQISCLRCILEKEWSFLQTRLF